MLAEGAGTVDNHHHVRAVRRAIREEQHDAYVLGEHVFEASAWLRGDRDDGAMNDYGFQRPLLAFWAGVDQRGEPLGLNAAGLDAFSRERFAASDEVELTLPPRSARTLVSDPSWLGAGEAEAERVLAANAAWLQRLAKRRDVPPGTVD